MGPNGQMQQMPPGCMPMPPWCQLVELPMPPGAQMAGAQMAQMGGAPPQMAWGPPMGEPPLPPGHRVVEPVRLVDDRWPGERHEIVREVPYEVIREVPRDVPIEVRREMRGERGDRDVPYWQREDFERQLDERKAERRDRDDRGGGSRGGSKGGSRGGDTRSSELSRLDDSRGGGRTSGGMRTSQGTRVWGGGDDKGGSGSGSGGRLRGRTWDGGGAGLTKPPK
jgi:hypothetical protein